LWLDKVSSCPPLIDSSAIAGQLMVAVCGVILPLGVQWLHCLATTACCTTGSSTKHVRRVLALGVSAYCR
jgi:hypothetical protein